MPEEEATCSSLRKKSTVTITGYCNFKCFMKKIVTYVELSNEALEVYESEKMYKKKKIPKIIIVLSHVFNVSDHWDPKLKRCINITTPDDVFLLKFKDDEMDSWLNELKEAIVAARACEFQRPFFIEQFFEAVWEGVIVGNPKVKKKMTKYDKVPNICAKSTELNNRVIRLCYYPHSVIVCNRGITIQTNDLPESEFPPFPKSQFIEIEKIYLSNYGSQENYVILRMGRSSTYGCCEIWIKMENNLVAENAHNKLSSIIERQKEKRNFIFHGQPNSEMEKSYQMLTKNENYAPDEEAEHRARFNSFDGNAEMYSAYQKLVKNKMREEEQNKCDILPNSIPSVVGNDEPKRNDENMKQGNKSPDNVERKSSGLKIFNPLSLIKDRTFSMKGKNYNKDKSIDEIQNDNENKKKYPSNDDYQFPQPFNTWQMQISQISKNNIKLFEDTETEDSGGTLKFVEQEEILSNKSGETINPDSIDFTTNNSDIYCKDDYIDMHTTINNEMIEEEEEEEERLEECIYDENLSPGECYNGIHTDSSMSCQSSICSVLGVDDEEILSHSSSISSKRHADFLNSTNEDLRNSLGRCIHYDDEGEYTPMDSNPSYNSPTHLSVPNSYDHHDDQRNLNYDSSDSCYSSIQATNSGRSHGTRTDSFSTNIHSRTSTMSSSASSYATKHIYHSTLNGRKNTIHGTSGFTTKSNQVNAILESDISIKDNQDIEIISDPRKRAFSLGSKNLLASKWGNKISQIGRENISTITSQNSQKNLSNGGFECFSGKTLLPIKNSQSSGDVQSNIKINSSTNSLKSNRSGSINSTTSSVSSKTTEIMEQKDNEYFMEMDFSGFLASGFIGGLTDSHSSFNSNPLSCVMRDRKASNGSKSSTNTSLDGKVKSRKTSSVKPTPFNGSSKSINKTKKHDFDNLTAAMSEVKCFIDSPIPINSNNTIPKKSSSNEKKEKKSHGKVSTTSLSSSITENRERTGSQSKSNNTKKQSSKRSSSPTVFDNPNESALQNIMKSQGDYILCAPAAN
ncbi:Pleckstrin homology domain and Pleckstrin homology-like domain-containing protein [Strongyloides ratti]|uniref:Pleckstrin homology domain and Pleckstrin homology-like domain-containing protein n=1 Tax=Strongyloides ratti TaxID=34506 RepID=A0A090MZL9_STRRB|nr:Pleckstrin homology domain and Pleckstrin homology-like domain-containing protein [Strongyloides ratti]CEF69164.1 Pleckstrin homology domain and Pleckstrin homology-like domain-containing protein [Strongyloides ratti]